MILFIVVISPTFIFIVSNGGFAIKIVITQASPFAVNGLFNSTGFIVINMQVRSIRLPDVADTIRRTIIIICYGVFLTLPQILNNLVQATGMVIVIMQVVNGLTF